METALKAIGSDEAGARNVILDDADRRTLKGGGVSGIAMNSACGLMFSTKPEHVPAKSCG
jgi:hypothetical protein